MDAQIQNIGTPEKNLKNFGSYETKGPKQDSQNRLRSHMSWGEEPQFY